MQIEGKNFLVTGGAGFIGSHIVDKLLEEGANKVFIYDNFSSGNKENISHLRNNKRVVVVQGDILDYDNLCKVMRKVDVVSHHAAQLEIFRALSDPLEDLKTNVIGTLNVLRAALKYKVQKIINASSACVYGQARYLPEDEAHPKRPQWPYGVSKLSAEKYCTMYYEFYGLPIVNLRYGIVYGPREWYGRVLTIFIKRILENKPPVIFGEGQQTRDFIHVSDVARAHNLCIESEKAIGETYNVGTGVKTTIKELAELVIKVLGKPLNPIFENPHEGDFSRLVPYRRRIPGELLNMVLDIKKAREELGWKPKVKLEEGIRTEIDWIKEKPTLWNVKAPKI
jgi:UDP-glucose 4-epimerase